MNVIAIIAARNEELTIGRCCRHLAEQGLRFVVIDNDSTDGTRDIVESFRGQGLIDVVRFPYPGHNDWIGLLKCKERLARELDGDWFMHLDADEIPEGGPPGTPLLERLREVDRAGCNAVNFDEFTFVPTTETERHEGTDYVTGMRRYYFFAPRQLRLIRLWRKAAEVNLSGSGGHNAVFTDRRLYPENFALRHYIALSMDHLIRKYSKQRVYSPAEVALGWHGWRAKFSEVPLRLPPSDLLADLSAGGDWDRSRPFATHAFLAPPPLLTVPRRWSFWRASWWRHRVGR